jgi:uncharacterized protein (TIGR03118 family)
MRERDDRQSRVPSLLKSALSEIVQTGRVELDLWRARLLAVATSALLGVHGKESAFRGVNDLGMAIALAETGHVPRLSKLSTGGEMSRSRSARFATVVLTAGLLLAVVIFVSGRARAGGGGFYRQVNLVSDLPGVARFQDPNLVNSWGLAHSPTGPWMVADNGTGKVTAYFGDGRSFPTASSPLVIAVPPPAGGTPPAAPTGNVFNSANATKPSEFRISETGKSGPSTFLFSTEDGTISGWNPNVDPTNAILAVDRSGVGAGAVYKGLAVGTSGSSDFLYATNFRFGTVEMFNAQFQLVRSFTDSALASDCPLPGQCFAPFGIQNILGKLYVTYALQNPAKHDDVAGAGNGFIDVFDTQGHLQSRFASHGTLNSPWGLALAPGAFGKFSNDLLVGDFGDGRINAFDLHNGVFLGQLADQTGNPITINGLWAIAFGNDALAGASDELFFASGLHDEADGLFGKISAQG